MAANSKDSKILAYKDTISQLNITLAAQTELIKSLQETLEADRLEKENLRQQIEYLAQDELPPIVLYHYTQTRAKYNAERFLKGFSGYLETDGYQGYNNLPGIKRCSCWSHMRRNGKFRLMGSKPRIPCNTRISLAVYFPFYLPYCIVLLSH